MSFSEPFLEDDMSCRICRDTEKNDTYCSPCACTGSMQLVHTTCIQTWIQTKRSSVCEVCQASYTIKVNKVSSCYYFLGLYGCTVMLGAITISLDFNLDHVLLSFSATTRADYILSGIKAHIFSCIYLYIMAIFVIPVHILFACLFGTLFYRIGNPVFLSCAGIVSWGLLSYFMHSFLEGYFFVFTPLYFLACHYACWRHFLGE